MARHIYTDTASYVVADGPLGHDWERTPVRYWRERTNTLLEPEWMGSIVAHTGGAGVPWREITRDEAPEALRALIDADPGPG